MIVIIDNYDSFVYNLARCFINLKKDVQIYKNNAISVGQIQHLNPSHLVLSAGPGVPKDSGICIESIRHFYNKIPILGVCLGKQAITEAFNGKLVQNHILHGESDTVYHNKHPLFKAIPNPFKAARYHSWQTCARHIPHELNIIAQTKKQEVMAIAHEKYPLFGVQFHPESIMTKHGQKIVSNFLNYKKNAR